MVEVISKQITVSLPDWFPRKSQDWTKHIMYPKGHRWAGTFDRSSHGNHDEDELWDAFEEIEGMRLDTVCIDHMRWVLIETELPDNVVVETLETFLKRLLDEEGS